MLILTRSDVRSLLTMDRCIELMEAALAALARGEAVQPLRRAIKVPDGSGLLATMPAYLGPARMLGLKAVTVFHGNAGTALPTHQGAILGIDPANGSVDSVMDAGFVTEVRTAAASAVATKHLSLPKADSLAILGAGAQGRTHVEAICAVRSIRLLRVWSRTPGRAQSLARDAAAQHQLKVEVAETPEVAVRGVEIVCTTTSAKEPVLEGRWLAPGTHINAVGASSAKIRELDTETIRRSRVFVDCRESAENEAGDLLIPIASGELSENRIVAELGDVVIGRHPGRESPTEITLFESLGIGIEDLAVARYLTDEARRRGVGVEVRLGG